MRDVAKACGVSAMTISAVLNNRPGFASEETRRRVLAKVEEMGYQPNAIARGLTQRRMNTVGVVMLYQEARSLMSDRYISPILDGIFAGNRASHQKTLIITEEHWEDVQENLSSYLDGHCDGFIFVLPFLSVEALSGFARRQIPFVIIGESRTEDFLSTVDMNNVQAAFDAVSHLIEAGHRRIAFLRGGDFLLSSGEREAGYRQALDRAGISWDDRLVLPGDYNPVSGRERMQKLLDLSPADRPTAVFCCDDGIAQGAWEAIRERGLSVPGDLSLIGINDDHSAELLGLTTIHQPLHRIGVSATKMVLGQIAGERAVNEKLLLPGTLVRRSSVAPSAKRTG